MKKNQRMLVGIGIMAAALMLTGTAMAQEHPEHPTEHPEHPQKEAQKANMTMEELSAAIKAYVGKDSELKGGMFLVYDSLQKTVLQLTLAKVHEDKLVSLGNGIYFACADFESHDKHLYDLDVFMEEGEDGKLVTTEVAVHKKDGVPRYTWQESEGVWSKKVVPGK